MGADVGLGQGRGRTVMPDPISLVTSALKATLCAPHAHGLGLICKW